MATSLRPETDRLVRLAEADLGRLWRLVAGGASAEVALHDLLPALVAEYGQAGAAMAAEWYDEQRGRAEVGGRFTAVPVDAADRGVHALVGWALTEARDDASLKALILGGVQRRIADHVRYTVTGNSVADPRAVGWQRMGAGACPFCLMLISRGAVYSEATADFASHDNCHCQAVPIFRGAEPIDVKDYVRSARNISDSDRARVREYLVG